MRKLIILAAAFAFLLGGFGTATAQVYPSRPITFIVPWAAGGPTDTIGRIMAERMRASLAQPIIIENVPGAGGSVGVGRVARATPDGYTVVVGNWGTHVVNGAIYPLQYDLLKDFEPVSLLPAEPLMIVAKKAMPAKDLRELIAWLKANPDKSTAGASGIGGPSYIAGVFLQQATGTRFQLVPYRGAAPAMQDLVAGQVDMMVAGPSAALSQGRAGSIKVYAVAAKSRLAWAADIPTVDEAGLPGFYISVWHGLWVPKGTPQDIISKLNAAAVDAMADPAVRQRIADLGQEITPQDQQTPGALGAFHKAEIEKWWPIIKAANIKAE
jgi:tripartite-type tricarboxylate transporter receptor subunit TctC